MISLIRIKSTFWAFIHLRFMVPRQPYPPIYRGYAPLKGAVTQILGILKLPARVENAHMFENETHKLESAVFVLNHHTGSPPADLDGKIGPPVPGVDLAHAGKIKPRDGCADGRDVFRMVHQGYRLGVFRA